jgi:hypothetical protein
MATRKIPGRGSGGPAQRLSSGPARLRILLALPAAAALAVTLAACGPSGSPSTHPAAPKPSSAAPSHAHSAPPSVPVTTPPPPATTPPPPATTPPAPPATSHTANPIPQGNGGDQDADNNGGPSDGDGNI